MQSILKLVIYFLVSPLVAISSFMVRFGLYRLNDDLNKCLVVVDSATSIPDRFVTTLLVAEDHRNSIHPGVDPIGISRALFVWIQTGRVQGASTIEQQFVRVVLERYERTLRRKLREQLVAIALSYSRSKVAIANAYLENAFYGSGLNGLSALTDACKPNLETASQDSITHMIASLKYPKPLVPTLEWHQKINNRMRYITARLNTKGQ